MIARIWRGQATNAKADAYFRHVTGTVFPSLKTWPAIAAPGCCGARPTAKRSSSPLTLWESLDSIRAFAGDDIATAIVEPEARAVLADFDDFARHYEVAFKTP